MTYFFRRPCLQGNPWLFVVQPGKDPGLNGWLVSVTLAFYLKQCGIWHCCQIA